MDRERAGEVYGLVQRKLRAHDALCYLIRGDAGERDHREREPLGQARCEGSGRDRDRHAAVGRRADAYVIEGRVIAQPRSSIRLQSMHFVA